MHYLIIALVEETGLTVEINGFPAYHQPAYAKQYIQKRVDAFLRPGANEIKITIDNPKAQWFAGSGMDIDLSIREFAEGEVIALNSGNFHELVTRVSDEDIADLRPLNLLSPTVIYQFSLDKLPQDNIGRFERYADDGEAEEVQLFCNQIRESFEQKDIDWLMKHTINGLKNRCIFFEEDFSESKATVQQAFNNYAQKPLQSFKTPGKPAVKEFLDNKVWATSAAEAWNTKNYIPLLTFLNPETEEPSGEMNIYVGKSKTDGYEIIYY